MVNRDIIAGISFNARKHLFKRKIEPRSVLRVETNRHPVMGHVRAARWQGYLSAHGAASPVTLCRHGPAVPSSWPP